MRDNAVIVRIGVLTILFIKIGECSLQPMDEVLSDFLPIYPSARNKQRACD